MWVIDYVHSLAASVLVGKVVLLSFIVAPILAKTLERESFGKVVRRLFPAYYLLGMAMAVVGLLAVAGTMAFRGGSFSLLATGALWLLVLIAESYCQSPLTPESNVMRDQLKEQEEQGTVDPELLAAWNRLHQRSVYLNSLVLLAGLSLIGLLR